MKVRVLAHEFNAARLRWGDSNPLGYWGLAVSFHDEIGSNFLECYQFFDDSRVMWMELVIHDTKRFMIARLKWGF